MNVVHLFENNNNTDERLIIVPIYNIKFTMFLHCIALHNVFN